MKSTPLILIALLLTPLASLQAAEPPGLAGSFPLGVYWPWERTAGLAKRNGLEKWAFVERCLDNLKRQGFDAVWAVNLGIPDLPGLAQRMAAREMKLVPALGELHYNIAWRRNNWTYLEKESKRAIEAAGEFPGHPGLGAVRRAAPGPGRRDGDVSPEVHRVGREAAGGGRHHVARLAGLRRASRVRRGLHRRLPVLLRRQSERPEHAGRRRARGIAVTRRSPSRPRRKPAGRPGSCRSASSRSGARGSTTSTSTR